jgi:cysteine desulfuration protein SufE
MNNWNGATLDEIREVFSLFDDWEDRYRYLIDLAKLVPPMDDSLKNDDSIVRGCTSRVWMVSDFKEGHIHFIADSDAHIVKGLIGLLMAIYNDKPISTLHELPIETIFAELGLSQNISPNRRNGFFAMVERLKTESNKQNKE